MAVELTKAELDWLGYWVMYHWQADRSMARGFGIAHAPPDYIQQYQRAKEDFEALIQRFERLTAYVQERGHERGCPAVYGYRRCECGLDLALKPGPEE